MIEPLEGRTFLSGAVESVAFPAVRGSTPVLADAAPNKLSRARDLGAIGGKAAKISGWVGAANPHDYFRLRLAQRGELTINLSQLSQTASVELLKSNGKRPALAAGRGATTAGARLSRELPAGTYFVHIQPTQLKGARLTTTPYRLSLSMRPKAVAQPANFAGAGQETSRRRRA
jgi:hypothetical protein